MAAKFFTGLPLDGPYPEFVQGCGAEPLTAADPASYPANDRPHRGPGGGWAAVGDQLPRRHRRRTGGIARSSCNPVISMTRRAHGDTAIRRSHPQPARASFRAASGALTPAQSMKVTPVR
jgi:hypothetical protein